MTHSGNIPNLGNRLKDQVRCLIFINGRIFLNLEKQTENILNN